MIEKKISEKVFPFFLNKGSIHIARILISLNIFVFILNVGAFYLYGQDSFYINRETIYLVFLIATQVHISLLIRRINSDPFVIILSFITITYYCFRVFTLLLFNHSDTFTRNVSYSSDDTTFTLFLILLFNFFMLFAFYLGPKVKFQRYKFSKHNYTHFIDTLLLSATLLLLLHMSGIWSYLISSSRFVKATLSLINLHWIIYFILFIIIMRLRYSLIVLKSHKIFIFFLISIYSMWLTIDGSRGYTVFFIEITAIGLLSLNIYYLKNHYLFKLLILGPFLILILYSIFTFASANREQVPILTKIFSFISTEEISGANDENTIGVVDIENSIELYENEREEVKKTLSKIFSRVGYLDISSEIISNKNRYESIFTPGYYLKSFVDNWFTPGFDIFDTPKVSRSLYFAHQYVNNEVPSKKFALSNNMYHSDMLTIYGEFFMLFGWWSLLIVFLFSYFLKFLYCLKFKSNDFGIISFLRPLTLLFFYWSLNSFGLDWIFITYFAPIFATLFLFTVYHKLFFIVK